MNKKSFRPEHFADALGLSLRSAVEILECLKASGLAHCNGTTWSIGRGVEFYAEHLRELAEKHKGDSKA